MFGVSFSKDQIRAQETTPTFMAAYLGNAKALRLILSFGLHDLETGQPMNYAISLTPLAAAVMMGRAACAVQLLCVGANTAAVAYIPRSMRNSLYFWVWRKMHWTKEMFSLVLQGSFQASKRNAYTRYVQEVYDGLSRRLCQDVVELVLQFCVLDPAYGAISHYN